MNVVALPSSVRAARACFAREWISHRLNRFLYAHVLLSAAAGAMTLLSPPEAITRGAPWWILNATLYAVSLSAMLLGLSSAHAENDELPLLLTQPVGTTALVAGKFAALAQIVMLSAILLAAPALAVGGWSSSLVAVVAGAAALSIVCATLGLAIGFWVRDAVRGLITVVGVWFVLLFGTDLALLGVAGAPLAQANPDLWITPLMLNPLDAFRVTVLFAVERVAYAGFEGGRVATWWISHAWGWLAVLFGSWTIFGAMAALLGARRRLDA